MAIKDGITGDRHQLEPQINGANLLPCSMPTLLAVSLNRLALSATLKAEVYAKAVSKTPGPVSVSEKVILDQTTSIGLDVYVR